MRLGSLALLLQAAPLALADSPSADEFPYWPASVKWDPQSPTKTCSPADIAAPHGSATWNAAFTSCVYTLAYFDTCDDQCQLAFSGSATNALNCSYDGTPGAAQEVESNRLLRCTVARQVVSKRYVPGPTPTAPKCSSEKLAAWNAAYPDAPEYSACFRKLVTARGIRTCTDDCQRVFHDAVSDADECLFSSQSGALTQHEWFKHLLVWCLDIRGEPLQSDPLLKVRGTSSPQPTTPKPTKTPAPTPSKLSSTSSSSSSFLSSAGEPSHSKSKSHSSSGSVSSSGSHAVGDSSSGSGPPIDFASSGGRSPINPAVSPPNPGTPNYGQGSGAPSQRTLASMSVLTIAGMLPVALL